MGLGEARGQRITALLSCWELSHRAVMIQPRASDTQLRTSWGRLEIVHQAALPTGPVRLQDRTDKYNLNPPWVLSLPNFAPCPISPWPKRVRRVWPKYRPVNSWPPLSHLRNDVLQVRGLDSLGWGGAPELLCSELQLPGSWGRETVAIRGSTSYLKRFAKTNVKAGRVQLLRAAFT